VTDARYLIVLRLHGKRAGRKAGMRAAHSSRSEKCLNYSLLQERAGFRLRSVAISHLRH
jgi:hypothetical protein